MNHPVGLTPDSPPQPTPPGLQLSVVIPCLNEEKSIAYCIRKAVIAMEKHGISGEVVVSDNGSTDRSIEVAEAAGARVVNCPVRGYGAALQFGFEQARGRWLLMGDADDSYDFSELPRFMQLLRRGHRFVMGTRLRGAILPGAMPLLNRYLGTPVLTFILNNLFGTKITDCNCGMRGIERDAFFEMNATSPGMEFASEMIVKAAIAGIPITEVPITLHKDRRDRSPHLQPWRDGWRHLRLLLWHAPDHMMTLPGLCALTLGLMMVLWQLAGPSTLGGVTFDFHYMILGITLSLLGQSSLAMGIAVHAISPERRLRTVGALGSVKVWFTFERAMMAAGVLLFLGLLCDGSVLWHWLAIHRGPLSLEYTRLSLAGLVLLSIGFHLALLGLLVGTSKSAISQPIALSPPSRNSIST